MELQNLAPSACRTFLYWSEIRAASTSLVEGRCEILNRIFSFYFPRRLDDTSPTFGHRQESTELQAILTCKGFKMLIQPFIQYIPFIMDLTPFKMSVSPFPLSLIPGSRNGLGEARLVWADISVVLLCVRYSTTSFRDEEYKSHILESLYQLSKLSFDRIQIELSLYDSLKVVEARNTIQALVESVKGLQKSLEILVLWENLRDRQTFPAKEGRRDLCAFAEYLGGLQ